MTVEHRKYASTLSSRTLSIRTGGKYTYFRLRTGETTPGLATSIALEPHRAAELAVQLLRDLGRTDLLSESATVTRLRDLPVGTYLQHVDNPSWVRQIMSKESDPDHEFSDNVRALRENGTYEWIYNTPGETFWKPVEVRIVPEHWEVIE